MSKPIWLMEDKSDGSWRVNQPYRLYKSEESALKGLERERKEVGTHIPRRIKEYRPVEDK